MSSTLWMPKTLTLPPPVPTTSLWPFSDPDDHAMDVMMSSGTLPAALGPPTEVVMVALGRSLMTTSPFARALYATTVACPSAAARRAPSGDQAGRRLKELCGRLRARG